MGKFVKHILIFFLLAIVVPLILAFILPSNPTNYLNAYGIKRDRLDSITQSRLLLIGFSDLAFGIDSQMLEDSLHLNVINCGLHAGLGSDFIIKDAIKDSRSGDLVVISITPAGYMTGTGKGETTSLPFLVDLYPHKWTDLSLINKWVVLEGTYELLKSKLIYGLKKTIGVSSVDKVYNSSNFNKYGDEYVHWSDTCKQIIPESIARISDINLDYFHQWTREVKKISDKGCQVLLIPCILQKESYEKSEKAISFLEQELHKEGFSYAISPKELVVDDSFLYNGASHANRKGTEFYTEKIISLFRSKNLQ